MTNAPDIDRINAPLKSVSAFLPPMSTQDFDLSTFMGGASTQVSVSGNFVPHKYVDIFDKPKGFTPFFDYDEALAAARAEGKPVMIDFTGHADDKTDLATGDRAANSSGRILTTIGAKWSYLQTAKFGANSQPYYVLLDPKTELPLVPPQGADYDPASYLGYLESGIVAFQAGKTP